MRLTVTSGYVIPYSTQLEQQACPPPPQSGNAEYRVAMSVTPNARPLLRAWRE